MNFEALEFQEGLNNMGGLRTIGYYGFIADVEVSSFPELPAAPANLEDAAVIASDIVMKAGKTMFGMYGTAETAGLNGESQGERDGRSTKRTATWFYPTTSKKTLGAALKFLNRNMFFLLQEHNGNYRLLGSPWFPAEVAANDTTGTAVTDRKGVTFTITDNGFGPCPIYEGAIPCDSAYDLGI
jgi:hypothetical protein